MVESNTGSAEGTAECSVAADIVRAKAGFTPAVPGALGL
jgi:hypothetical protein